MFGCENCLNHGKHAAASVEISWFVEKNSWHLRAGSFATKSSKQPLDRSMCACALVSPRAYLECERSFILEIKRNSESPTSSSNILYMGCDFG